MIKLLHIILLTLLFVPHNLYADGIKKVKATYAYKTSDNITIEEAKNIALERAKIKAIADEFGTIVSMSNTTIMGSRNNASNVDFLSLSGSEIKGEWIETTVPPLYSVLYEQNMLLVTCTIEGRARELKSARVEFKAKLLRNGLDDKYESDEFVDGDDFFLSFKSPVSGYIAVFLLDSDNNVHRLLPYRSDNADAHYLKGKKRHLLFSQKASDYATSSYVDEYTFTANSSLEYNRLYVLFSRNKFVASTNDEVNATGGLPSMSVKDFQKWLAKVRKHDEDMQIEVKFVKIRSKE